MDDASEGLFDAPTHLWVDCKARCREGLDKNVEIVGVHFAQQWFIAWGALIAALGVLTLPIVATRRLAAGDHGRIGATVLMWAPDPGAPNRSAPRLGTAARRTGAQRTPLLPRLTQRRLDAVLRARA